MNTLNRIIAICILLVAFILLAALAIAPFESIDWLRIQLGNFNVWATAFQHNNALFFNLARLGLALIAFLIVIPLLLAEIPRKKEPTVRLRSGQGDVQVTAESIAKRLAWHLDQLADVIAVSPTVTPKGEKVHINLDVETSPEIDVPMKTEEIMLVTREIIEKDMGLKLGKLRINIRHASYPQGI